MPRIRTIKPEFPQSESMGRVSREARLCFLLLFTLSDDHGKLRGNSRMLASLLYPYDDDAPRLIDKWLAQLQNVGCIVRYQIGADHYLKISNWESHQKVDRPSASKIPEPREDSRDQHETPRFVTAGSEDQGSEDQGRDQRRGTRFGVESLPHEWEAFCRSERPDLDPARTFLSFRDYWTAQTGQRANKTDWLATWRNWIRNEKRRPPDKHGGFAKQDYFAGTEGFEVVGGSNVGV